MTPSTRICSLKERSGSRPSGLARPVCTTPCKSITQFCSIHMHMRRSLVSAAWRCVPSAPCASRGGVATGFGQQWLRLGSGTAKDTNGPRARPDSPGGLRTQRTHRAGELNPDPAISQSHRTSAAVTNGMQIFIQLRYSLFSQ